MPPDSQNCWELLRVGKLEADNHQVLEDDTDDENGASIMKINIDLRTQQMIWGFQLKNPLWLHMCPYKQSLMDIG